MFQLFHSLFVRSVKYLDEEYEINKAVIRSFGERDHKKFVDFQQKIQSNFGVFLAPNFSIESKLSPIMSLDEDDNLVD